MSKYLKGIYDEKDFYKLDKPSIILVGRSNVGKSSLINKLLKGDFAKVSQKPGKTRAVHLFDYDNLYLVDLPGYGYARASKSDIADFQELTNSYLSYVKDDNVLVLLLVDAKVSLTELDKIAINYFKSLNMNFIFVVTKVDKTNQSSRAKLEKDLKTYDAKNIFYTSTLKNIGYDKLDNYLKGEWSNE